VEDLHAGVVPLQNGWKMVYIGMLSRLDGIELVAMVVLLVMKTTQLQGCFGYEKRKNISYMNKACTLEIGMGRVGRLPLFLGGLERGFQHI